MRLNIAFLALLTSLMATAQTINLAGTWRFTTNPGMWNDSIKLPGSMLTNGKGEALDINTPWTGGIVGRAFLEAPEYEAYRQAGAEFRVPFWLQPDLYYAGEAWYSKDFTTPADWKGKDVILTLERPHWQTTVWVDGKEAGKCRSLGTPHVFNITQFVKAGKKQTLTVCIDNCTKELDPGENSHSVSDHTQGNWNGMVGEMKIEARPRLRIERLDVYPDLDTKDIELRATVVNNTGKAVDCAFNARSGKNTARMDAKIARGTTQHIIHIKADEEMQAWDEFQPNLYKATLTLGDDSRSARFGFRRWSTESGSLTLNGHPAFMRGTLHCAAFPLTGHPAMDRDEWQREFGICKSYGLNHIRFHSWCPPEVAFEVADEMGMYLHIECSSWANQSTTIGDGGPLDEYILDEARRMVEDYGNHPSFCFLAYGNEPGGNHHKEYLARWVETMKALDSRRLYTTAAGWPNLPVSDFYSDPHPRIQRWGEGVNSIINAKAPSTAYDWRGYTSKLERPVISHEIGQWCVYPNLREMQKYTGVYKARNYEIFQRSLAANGMAHLADSFLMASGKLQTLCYKADIEAALRTPGFAGYHLLGLNDFPGQGTALVGCLDAFWEEKGYTTADEYRRFAGSVVPLARMEKLIYTQGDTMTAYIEVANFHQRLLHPSVAWRVIDGNACTMASGTFHPEAIGIGAGLQLGRIVLPLSVATPQQLKLEVEVAGHKNDWNLWVFDKPQDLDTAGCRIVDKIDTETARFLQNGGDVLLSLRPGGEVKVGFSSIFWNTAWTEGQAPHTLGILCNPRHPALAHFPTSWHSDYQWQDAMSHCHALRLDRLSTDLQPVVRIIDDWFTNRPLGMFIEARVGRGRILVSAVDFSGDLTSRPAANALLGSLLRYMHSPAFSPSATLSVEDIDRLM